jgi:hypothetical protein
MELQDISFSSMTRARHVDLHVQATTFSCGGTSTLEKDLFVRVFFVNKKLRPDIFRPACRAPVPSRANCQATNRRSMISAGKPRHPGEENGKTSARASRSAAEIFAAAGGRR